MITATPDDADAENFRKAAGIKELHKVTVTREEVVKAGLIKPSIHSIAYISPPDQAVMADFEAAALSDAVATHRSIKQALVDEGINLVPLLMVQVHTEKGVDTVEEARRALVKLGFSEDAITAHTSVEPDKINKMTSQLAKASPFTMVTKVGGVSQLQLITKGQPQLFPTAWKSTKAEDGTEEEETSFGGVVLPPETIGSQSMLELLGELSQKAETGGKEADQPSPKESHVYHLKEGSPLRFRTQELPLEVDDLLNCIEQQIGFNDRDMLNALAESTEIIRIEKSHFQNLGEETRTRIKTRIDLEKAEWQAQQVLLRQQYLSAKDLQDHLLKRLAREFQNNGQHAMAEDEERLEAALALIIVQNPRLLKDAEKACAARFSTTRDAEPLPGFIESAFPLKSSFKNIYGVFPDDLNPWEVEFAKLLDNDTSGNVLWWHRNPVKKKYSVCIVRPDGGRFFPDFVVGVKGRKGEILLIETKYAIGSLDSQIKAVVEHKDYGRALMIHWKDWVDENRRVAMTVQYEPDKDKNVLEQNEIARSLQNKSLRANSEAF